MTPEEQKRAIEDVAVRFEKKHGTEALLKVCFSSLSRALVDSGALSESTLLVSFLKHVKQHEELSGHEQE